jgi:hypothetical protein
MHDARPDQIGHDANTLASRGQVKGVKICRPARVEHGTETLGADGVVQGKEAT